MQLYIKKQWARSTLLGFLRRMGERLYGRKCYMVYCYGRMHRTRQDEMQDGTILERWVCSECLAATEERY
jgi:hypothetical protein